jgi:hypothetical protein
LTHQQSGDDYDDDASVRGKKRMLREELNPYWKQNNINKWRIKSQKFQGNKILGIMIVLFEKYFVLQDVDDNAKRCNNHHSVWLDDKILADHSEHRQVYKYPSENPDYEYTWQSTKDFYYIRKRPLLVIKCKNKNEGFTSSMIAKLQTFVWWPLSNPEGKQAHQKSHKIWHQVRSISHHSQTTSKIATNDFKNLKII